MDDLGTLLDELAARVAAVTAEEAGLPAAATVVSNLERLAGASPGELDRNAALVARRFARVHRLLLETTATEELLAQLRRQLALLGDPFPAMLTAWNQWQDLRRVDGPLVERLAARCMVDLSRRRIPAPGVGATPSP